VSRYLALDVGDERIGLAISDADGRIARPLEVLPRVRGNASFMQICRIISQYNVQHIVVGWPLLSDGKEGKQTRSVAAYLRGLAQYTELPITRWDERFTTHEADEIMLGNAERKSTRQKRRDAVAAAVILQQYLNQLAEEPRE